jgi:hypothetical protein
MISPSINSIFIVVNQYSISPYRRTLHRLNKMGMTGNIVIIAEEGIDSVEGQNWMNWVANTALLG